MTEQKKKRIYWMLQALSFLVSAGIPIAAVYNKFPNWVREQSTGSALGAGAIFAIVILCVTFRKTLFSTLKARLGITSVPPFVGWAVFLVAVEGLSRIATILHDVKVICIAGVVGSLLGMACSVISNFFRPAKNAEEDHVNGEDRNS